MILHSDDKQKFQHVSSILHEGKVVLVATEYHDSQEGVDYGVLWYTIKQDGFEDSYLHADPAHRTGWEKWRKVPLPGLPTEGGLESKTEVTDQSVLDKEKKEYAVPKGSEDLDDLLIRSRYNSFDQSEVAPVQIVSGLGLVTSNPFSSFEAQ